MRQTKLEVIIDILKILAQNGSLKISYSTCKTNITCSVLEEYLGLLLRQGLVDQRNVGKLRMDYSITQRGINVLEYFKELKQVLPIN